MKHAHILANERLPHQKSWGGAFGEGLKRRGWRVTASAAPVRCDLLCMWGVRQRDWIDAQKRAGGEVVILERGYMLDRFAWCSVSFGGGLNGRGIFRGPSHDGSRWEQLFGHLVQPWRRRDGYALLIGQVPGDMSLAGKDLGPWYRTMASYLARDGWDVRFRPHPRAIERGYRQAVEGVRTQNGDLAAALAGAGLVVTYNSNTGVESVLAGVPTIAVDEGAMCWPVAGHSLKEIVTPDRTPWAHWLAYCQWTREELASGECWDAVGSEKCAPAA